jgi:hypothetical protein
MGVIASGLQHDLTKTDFINITNDLLSNKISIKKCNYYITHNNGSRTDSVVIINNIANNTISLYKILFFDKKSSKEFIKLYNNYTKINKYDKFNLDNSVCLKLHKYNIFYDYRQYKGLEDMPIICNIKPDINIKYDNIWIGKDINVRNASLPPYFGYGNNIMYQKNNKLYIIQGLPYNNIDNIDNPIYILGNDTVIGYFSPIDNNVPIPIILTTKKIIILFDKIYKFTANDINYNKTKINELFKTNYKFNDLTKIPNKLNIFYDKIDKIIEQNIL